MEVKIPGPGEHDDHRPIDGYRAENGQSDHARDPMFAQPQHPVQPPAEECSQGQANAGEREHGERIDPLLPHELDHTPGDRR